MHVARTGRIGATDAELGLIDDAVHLRWRGTLFDLTGSVVRHRDDAGLIRFSVTRSDGGVEATDYARSGPSVEDRLMDQIDFTADEPWTWEDSDFGLFVFHVATGTGPLKYRHTLEPSEPARAPRSTWPPRLTGSALERSRENARSETVDLGTLVEVRAKFEVSGIWSAMTLLTLDDGEGLVVVPIEGSRHADWVRDELAAALAELPGWDDADHERLNRAVEFARRRAPGPVDSKQRDDWAEWSIWER